jgi:iron complex outermembrane recepter protein
MPITLARKLKFSLLSSAVLAALTSAAVYAQEDVAAVDDESGTERIKVTSRRKSETIVEISINVSTVGAMEIADRNLPNKEDLFRSIARGEPYTDQTQMLAQYGLLPSAPSSTNFKSTHP